MQYTTISEEFKELYRKKYEDTISQPSWEALRTLCYHDAGLFAFHFIGIKPYDYQDLVLSDKGNRILICSSRQIGKTFTVAIKALHYATYRKNKKVLIVSRDDKAAKRVVEQIRELVFRGNQFMNDKTQQSNGSKTGQANIFPAQFARKSENNKSVVTLDNGTKIESYPPTDSIRGISADLVIIDEAAHIEDDMFFKVILPTIRFTNGSIFMMSTPKGLSGFFYQLFDPENRDDEHEYSRYWWNWRLCQNESFVKETEKQKKVMDDKFFAQEYEASFVVASVNFFDSKEVEACVNYELREQDYGYEGIVGIDYGLSESRTVVTLTIKDEKGKLIPIYQKAFELGYDTSGLIEFIDNLSQRFKIHKIVVDDCPQGDTTNKLLANKGYYVIPFNFRQSKVKYYIAFRQKVHNGFVSIPYTNKELIREMEELQQEDNKIGTLSINKPRSGFDDRVASFIMSCAPYIDEEETPKSKILVW